ncbi:MAG: protein kinase, partial [Planctomycetota bacterium]|nr:protein kinase [Planctomycetota bacterium]
GLFPDDHRQQRFIREARVLASLQTPGIVPIHDHGQTEEGTFFFVMDLLDGVSLADVLQVVVDGRVRLSAEDWSAGLGIATHERTWLQQLVAWMAQLADALQIAHEAGIVHRDLKPSNVFITRDGRAVLLDFGIAIREGDSSLTAEDTTLGTPWYMAPEQAMGGDTAQPVVDVYGLGASLYHLLTKDPPFSGDPVEVIFKLQTETPVPPGQLVEDLPRDLCAIVEHAIERDAGHRYPSMAAFAEDLRAFLDHRPVAARPISGVRRLARRIRRRPAVMIGLLIALVAVVGALIYVPLQISAEAEHRQRYEQLRATVPALVCLEGYPEHRLAEDMTESARAVATLTEMIDLRPDDLVARMMRASLFLDRGERAACVADLRSIKAQQESPYTAALLKAYETAADSVRGAKAIPLDQLPEPMTAFDQLIAGFHLLRRRGKGDVPMAHTLLGASGLPQARDLRILTWLDLGAQSRHPKDRPALLNRAHDEALKLEGEYSRMTARTRHVVGASLVALKRYREAEQPLKDSLRLRPDRHGPIHNLGIVYRRIGNLDLAERYLHQAHELRPWLWNTLKTLSLLQCDLGNFDAALARAEKIPSTGSMGEEWRRPLLIARVHLRRSYHALGLDDQQAAAKAAAQAVTAFDESFAEGCKEAATANVERGIMELVAKGTSDDLLFPFLNLWSQDLSNPVMVQNLEVLLRRDSLSKLEIGMLRLYLLRLAKEQSPDDPDLPPRFQALIKEIEQLLK